MEQNIAVINVALTMKFAALMAAGRGRAIEKEVGANPVDLLARPPQNYLGALYAPEPASLPAGCAADQLVVTCTLGPIAKGPPTRKKGTAISFLPGYASIGFTAVLLLSFFRIAQGLAAVGGAMLTPSALAIIMTIVASVWPSTRAAPGMSPAPARTR